MEVKGEGESGGKPRSAFSGLGKVHLVEGWGAAAEKKFRIDSAKAKGGA